MFRADHSKFKCALFAACVFVFFAPAISLAEDDLIIIEDDSSDLIIIEDDSSDLIIIEDETGVTQKSGDIEKRLFAHESEALIDERFSARTQAHAFADVFWLSNAQPALRFEGAVSARYVFERRLSLSAEVFAKSFIENDRAQGFADFRELALHYQGSNLALTMGKIIVPIARTQVVALSDRLNPIDQRRSENFAPLLQSRLPRWGAHLCSQAGPFDLEFALIFNEEQSNRDNVLVAHFGRYQDSSFARLASERSPSGAALIAAKTRALNIDFGAQLLSRSFTLNKVPSLSLSLFGAKSFGIATLKSEVLFEPNTPASSGLSVLTLSAQNVEQSTLNHFAGALSLQGDLFNHLGGAVEIFARGFTGIARGHTLLGLESAGQSTNETRHLVRAGVAFALAGSVFDELVFWSWRGESGSSLASPLDGDLRARALLGARLFDSALQAGLRADLLIGAVGTPGAFARESSRIGIYLSTAP